MMPLRCWSRLGAALLAAMAVSGCRNPGYTPEEEADARKIQWGRPFYESGKGTPAEYATNQRGQLNHEGAIVRGEIDGDYAAAVRALASCYREAAIGFAWREPRTTAKIPVLRAMPVIDGVVDEEEWRGALTFEGEFPLNSPERTAGEPSCWRVGWRGNSFYVAAQFRDPDLQIFESQATGDEPKMFKGDSLECFIRPRSDQFLYWEFIANPAGSLWELMHVNNPWGGSVTLANALRTGARAAAIRTGEGFSVELVLPLQEFHGVWCRRPPRPGDRFEFILVRTRLDNGVYTKNSPVPFLYDGHNIFGYIRAELGAPGEEGSTAPEKD